MMNKVIDGVGEDAEVITNATVVNKVNHQWHYI